jgi:hypothetical protein
VVRAIDHLPGGCKRLLDQYQAEPLLRERLLSLAEVASGKGWWEAFSDVAATSYFDLKNPRRGL